MKGINKYSVVLPVFNEEKSLEELIQRLIKVFNGLQESYEIIFVNDGSLDNSWSVIKKIASKNNKVKAVSFRRNFGRPLDYRQFWTKKRFENLMRKYGRKIEISLSFPWLIAKGEL